jgi:hypothetical protein
MLVVELEESSPFVLMQASTFNDEREWEDMNTAMTVLNMSDVRCIPTAPRDAHHLRMLPGGEGGCVPTHCSRLARGKH